MTTQAERIYDLIARMVQDGPLVKDAFIRECEAILGHVEPMPAHLEARIKRIEERSKELDAIEARQRANWPPNRAKRRLHDE